ncbi:heterogeneous nuclear ribonucleoprotein D-like [Macrosteles quadrilineatus]|uniref:heterogeneous nuclear ribonucleoprotein D-like n=1 Tax=Macrosteles quadrilineatus TaxID=74068 RepID=UPI0023E2A28F|nr:heterogeneous nuclear ribonucleoprotein D-like [Macrosteles quadrilineatus]
MDFLNILKQQIYENVKEDSLKLTEEINWCDFSTDETGSQTSNETLSHDNSLYVGNLGLNVRQVDLYNYFCKYGEIKSVHLKTDSVGRLRGYAFVNFESSDSVDKVLSSVHFIEGKFAKTGRALGKSACNGLKPFPKVHPVKHSPNNSSNNSDKVLFVGNLDQSIAEEDLHTYFCKYGQIRRVDLKIDSVTGRPRGYAFVVFKTAESVDRVLSGSVHIINEREVDVGKALGKTGGKGNSIPKVSTKTPKHNESLNGQRNKLYVGNLSWHITREELNRYFCKYGVVQHVDLKTDSSGMSKGYAFVHFKNAASVDRVLLDDPHLIKDTVVDTGRALERHGKVFVGGLPREVSQSDILNYFSDFGRVIEIKTPYDPDSRERRGYCFVTLDSEQSVRDLMGRPEHVINGVTVSVKRQIRGTKEDRREFYVGSQGTDSESDSEDDF